MSTRLLRQPTSIGPSQDTELACAPHQLNSQATFVHSSQSILVLQFLHAVSEKLLSIASADAPIGGAIGVPHFGQRTRLLIQLHSRMLTTNRIKNTSWMYRLSSAIGKLDATNKTSDILYLFNELMLLPSLRAEDAIKHPAERLAETPGTCVGVGHRSPQLRAHAKCRTEKVSLTICYRSPARQWCGYIQVARDTTDCVHVALHDAGLCRESRALIADRYTSLRVEAEVESAVVDADVRPKISFAS
jgi:hypothetical protein